MWCTNFTPRFMTQPGHCAARLGTIRRCSLSLIAWLASKNVVLVGIDTLCVDPATSQDLPLKLMRADASPVRAALRELCRRLGLQVLQQRPPHTCVCVGQFPARGTVLATPVGLVRPRRARLTGLPDPRHRGVCHRAGADRLRGGWRFPRRRCFDGLGTNGQPRHPALRLHTAVHRV